MTVILKWILGNKTVSIVLAALIVFGVIVGVETFSLPSGTKVLLAELSAAQAHEKTVAAKADKDRAAAGLDLAAKDVLIASLRGDLIAKDGQIAALTGQQKTTEVSLAAAKTDAERVPLLTALVADWTSKFNLADAKCATYEGIVFNLNAQLADKDTIIASWTSQYDASQATNVASGKALVSVRADLRRAKFWGTVKSGVIISASGYVAYKTVWPLIVKFFKTIFKIK